jgi:hypothetical protein
MPTIKRAAEAKKPLAKPRTRRRVTDTEDTSGANTKAATHRQATAPVAAMAQQLNGNEMLITAQLSEVVPVAQYANVTLGPNQLAWKLGVDMSVLADVNWDDESDLTEEQQQVVDLVLGSLRATSKLLEIHMSEDRETVDRSVRQHNEREQSEASEKRKTRARR